LESHKPINEEKMPKPQIKTSNRYEALASDSIEHEVDMYSIHQEVMDPNVISLNYYFPKQVHQIPESKEEASVDEGKEETKSIVGNHPTRQGRIVTKRKACQDFE
jgi:hypothetical protein